MSLRSEATGVGVHADDVVARVRSMDRLLSCGIRIVRSISARFC